MHAFRPGNRIHKKQDLTFSTGSFKILTCFLRGSISLQLTPCLGGLNLVALLNMASKLTSDLLSEMVQIVITPRNKYAKQMFSHKLLFLKNGPTPASFSFIFVFPNTHCNCKTNKCKKCPSSIQCRDPNSQPLEYESPPIGTRPGLLGPLAKIKV